MIHDEGRLQKVLLYIFLEEQVQDIAFLMSLFKNDVVLFCQLSCLLQSLYLVPVNVCLFLHSVHHGQALKGLAQIHLDAFVYDLCGSKNLLCHIAVQILC